MKTDRSDDERVRWAKLLRRLAECIEGASRVDIDELISGNARFQIVIEKRQDSQKSIPAMSERETTDWPEIIKALRSLPTRDAGMARLKEVAPSRMHLERLARVMDLPVAKHENVELLREKIVEASIGSRLVSRAIRGEAESPKEE